jgi:hypothetical protein
LDPEGAGRIVIDRSAPATLTPGWLKRYEQLQSWAATKLNQLVQLLEPGTLTLDVRQLLVASLTGTSKELHTVRSAMDPTKGIIAFGVRRIARLSDPRTGALLTQATQHLGRAAEEGALLREPPPA